MKKLGTWCALFVLAICLQELGVGANRLVMYSNGSRMPVLVTSDDERQVLEVSERHCPLTLQTKFWLLSDIFIHPFFHGFEMEMEESSIGDSLMDFGNLVFVILPLYPLFWVGRWVYVKKSVR